MLDLLPLRCRRTDVREPPVTLAWREVEVYARLMAGDPEAARGPLADLRARAAATDRELLAFLEVRFSL